MNRNMVIVLAGGFVIALLVAMIVQASLGKKDGDGHKVEVAVASRSLATGTNLKASDAEWKAWPEDSVIEGAIVRSEGEDIEKALKGRLRRDVVAGEPLLRSAIATESKGNILMTTMDPGMRAVSVKVSPEMMVGGFLNPGDRVDVILTHQIKSSGKSKDVVEQAVTRYVSETILKNIRVLAVDQVARKDDEKAKVGKTVTLEVDQAGAEKISIAVSMGKLNLALRGLAEPDVAKAKLKENGGVMTDVEVSKAIQLVNQLKKTSGGNRDIVRVYNGDIVQNVTVRR